MDKSKLQCVRCGGSGHQSYNCKFIFKKANNV